MAFTSRAFGKYGLIVAAAPDIRVLTQLMLQQAKMPDGSTPRPLLQDCLRVARGINVNVPMPCRPPTHADLEWLTTTLIRAVWAGTAVRDAVDVLADLGSSNAVEPVLVLLRGADPVGEDLAGDCVRLLLSRFAGRPDVQAALRDISRRGDSAAEYARRVLEISEADRA